MTMKAAVYTKYGAPEVVGIQELARPTPKVNEVLIKIHAGVVTASDSAFRKGSAFAARLATGLTKPKRPTLGSELSGTIEAVGSNVTGFNVGDPVYASTGDAFGAHAEYICLPEDGAIAFKPANVSHGEAAAASDGGLTALTFLRDAAGVHSGQQVLINGASGSVGSFAVQLAKHFGAVVTGVCSTGNMELAASLGADQVIDYTQADFTRNGERYDVIFDTVGKRSFPQCRRSLKPGGIYLTTVLSGSILLHMLWTAKLGRRTAKIAFAGLRPPAEKTKDLNFLKELIEAGTIKSVIDRRYPLQQIAEAHRYVDQGHKKGSVVLEIVDAG